MTATELRELLKLADDYACAASANVRSLLRPFYQAGRIPGRHRLDAARAWARLVPSFGSVALEEAAVIGDELRLIETRACPGRFHPERWRPSHRDTPEAVVTGRLWLVADREQLTWGAAPQSIFALPAGTEALALALATRGSAIPAAPG